MTTKHTDGPWVWVCMRCHPERPAPCADHGGYYELVHFDVGQTFPNGEPLYTRIVGDGSAAGEYSADIDPTSPNGQLLAAAPDLLGALRALLADAEQVQAGPVRLFETREAARAAIAKAEGRS